MTRDQMIARGIDPSMIMDPIKPIEPIRSPRINIDFDTWSVNELLNPPVSVSSLTNEEIGRYSEAMAKVSSRIESGESVESVESGDLKWWEHYIIWSNILVFGWVVYAALNTIIMGTTSPGHFVIAVATMAVCLYIVFIVLAGIFILAPSMVTFYIGMLLTSNFGYESFIGGIGGVLMLGSLGIIYVSAGLMSDWHRARYWKALWNRRTPDERAFGSIATHKEISVKGSIAQRKR